MTPPRPPVAFRRMTKHATPELDELRESPPAKIATGLGTLLGLGATATAIAPLIIDLVTREDLDERLRLALIIVAGVVTSVVMLGRYAQAVAVELRRGGEALPLIDDEAAAPDTATRELDARLRSLTRTVTELEKAEARRRMDRPADAELKKVASDDDGDADLVDSAFYDVIEAGGDEDDQHDLHDRHDVPDEAR